MEYRNAVSDIVRDIVSIATTAVEAKEHRPKRFTLQELKQHDLILVTAWFFNHSTDQVWKIPYHAFGPGCFHAELFENGVKVGGINVYDDEITKMKDQFSIVQLGLEDEEVHHAMR